MADPRLGTTFAGYRIDRMLGRGGMGIVYAAEQMSLGREVALKLIAPELASDESLRARFEGEARLAASLDHPNIIPLFEAGEFDNTLFLAMRMVDGTDLRTVLMEGGAMRPDRAAHIVEQIAAALDAAHAAGLVHRDVKPANVLVTKTDHVYLTDFGLTKRAGSEGLTKTGQWVGTLQYVAPEQISGGPVDARADVYALGCVVFEMLTGVVPFKRDSDVATMFAHMNDPPPQPSRSVLGLDDRFDDVVDRALAKSPDARFQSAGDLARAVRAAAEQEAPQAPERIVARGEAAPASPPPVPLGPPIPPPAPAPAPVYSAGYQQPWSSQGYSQPPQKKDNTTLYATIGAVVLALIVAAVILAVALGGGGSDSTTTSQASVPATQDTGTTTTQTHKFPYPQSTINTFVDQCTTSSGGKRKVCECAIGELQDTLPYADFLAADTAIREGKDADPHTTNLIAAATLKCGSAG